MTPAQVRVLRRVREGTHRSTRTLHTEAALMRRGLIVRDPRGAWMPTRAGWSVDLPPLHFVLVNGREREVELREDGAFLYGESAAYPLNRSILATALGVRPEQLQPAERGVLITGSVSVHVR